MNKKNILKTMAVAAIATLAMTSCNQSAPKVDAKSDAAQPTSKEMKIAYVEVDSIMSQYQFCKDYSMVRNKTATTASCSCKLPAESTAKRLHS